MPAASAKPVLDSIDRQLINTLQHGIPVCEQPYLQLAQQLGIDENEILRRLQKLLDDKILSRVGPIYNAEKMGGGLTLAAMRLPEEDFDRVAEQVNSFDEIAHNYTRDNVFNMWFVIATEKAEQLDEVIIKLEKTTGYPVYNMPKIEEYYIGLHLAV
jgi:DNA-binding Lrp family transcriptional regulator